MTRVLPAPARVIRAATPSAVPAIRAEPVWVSLPAAWRDAIATCVDRAAPVALCAAFGFAGPLIAGYWAAAQGALQSHAWIEPQAKLLERLSPPAVLAQAVGALALGAFARGVIAALALEGGSAHEAARTAVSRYPALVLCTVAQCALVMLGVAAIGRLVEARPSPHSEVPARADLPMAIAAAANALTARVAFAPFMSVDPALATLAVQAGLGAAPTPASLTHYERWLNDTEGAGLAPAQPDTGIPRAAALAVLLALVLVEPLLRFHMVSAIRPSRYLQVAHVPGGEGSRRSAAIAPFAGARLVARHYGAALLHTWVTRVACVTLLVAFVDLPSVAARHVVLPNLIALAGRSPLLPWLGFAQLSAAALAGGLVLAFCAVHDAQLFGALGWAHNQAARPASAIARSSRSATPISGAHVRK